MTNSLGSGDGLMTTTTQSPGVAFVGVMNLHITVNPLSLNARTHWAVKAKLNAQWRAFAKLSAMRWPALPACDVTLTQYVHDKRRRDEDNIFGLLKPLCDGLVDAGVVEDDTANFMGKQCRIVYDLAQPAQFVLTCRSRAEGTA